MWNQQYTRRCTVRVSLSHPLRQIIPFRDDSWVLFHWPHVSATSWFQEGATEAPTPCWCILMPLIPTKDRQLSPLRCVRGFCSSRLVWDLQVDTSSSNIPAAFTALVRVTGCLAASSKMEYEFLSLFPSLPLVGLWLSWLVRGKGRTLAMPFTPTVFRSSSDSTVQPHRGRQAVRIQWARGGPRIVGTSTCPEDKGPLPSALRGCREFESCSWWNKAFCTSHNLC